MAALLLAGAVLVGGSHKAIVAIRSSPSFQLAGVVVQGTCLLDRSEIAAYCRPLFGSSLFALNLSLTARIIEAHPMVKRTVVRRMLPDSLVIRVEERKPVALLVLRERLHGVDDQAVLLPPLRPSVQPNLPLITGWRPDLPGQACGVGDPIRSNSLSTALDFLRTVEAFDPLMVFEISEVCLDNPDDLAFYLVDRGIRVRVGKRSYGKKIAGLRAVLSQLGEETQDVQYIDLRFEGQVVVGRKNT